MCVNAQIRKRHQTALKGAVPVNSFSFDSNKQPESFPPFKPWTINS